MFELTVISRFAAAHQLKLVAKKCENLHGHNWKIEVRLSGKRLNDAGVLMDFGEIKAHVTDILNELDHSFLNDKAVFAGGNPSSENIAVFIAATLQQRITTPGVRISRVTAWESEDAGAAYFPDTP